MSNSTNVVQAGGVSIGPASLLGVAFVVLKLCHVIDWSWWWVTCPFWGPFVLVLAILAVIGLCAGIVFTSICIYEAIKK